MGSLYVQFSDGPKEMTITWSALSGAGKFTSLMHVIRESYEQEVGARRIISSLHGPATYRPRSIGLQAAVALLHGRTTSKPRDELLCFVLFLF